MLHVYGLYNSIVHLFDGLYLALLHYYKINEAIIIPYLQHYSTPPPPKALFKTDVFNKHLLETYPIHSIHFEFIMCLGMVLFILFGCFIEGGRGGGGGVIHVHLSILPLCCQFISFFKLNKTCVYYQFLSLFKILKYTNKYEKYLFSFLTNFFRYSTNFNRVYSMIINFYHQDSYLKFKTSSFLSQPCHSETLFLSPFRALALLVLKNLAFSIPKSYLIYFSIPFYSLPYISSSTLTYNPLK